MYIDIVDGNLAFGACMTVILSVTDSELFSSEKIARRENNLSKNNSKIHIALVFKAWHQKNACIFKVFLS
jgi:3-methyladenine DNA glycosylase AlkC